MDRLNLNEAQFRQIVLDSYLAAVAAADPMKIVARHLPPTEKIRLYKKTIVLAAGKAAASMAMAVEKAWPADAPLTGLAVTRYGHALPCERIEVVQASHPVPDEAGRQAAQKIFDLAQRAEPDDLVLVLISGGGSSLLSLPVQEVSLDDLRNLTQQLLACGAPIQDMNVVRKHLSRIQGGGLAQVCRAPLLTLVISDVVGDDLSAIASGPTVPDDSTFQDALAILEKYAVRPPASIAHRLEQGAAGKVDETPKSGNPCFDRNHSVLIATARASLAAGAEVFERAGIDTLVLGDDIEGEACEVGAKFAQDLAKFRVHKKPGRPLAIISGGECTVTLKPQVAGHANPRGGRCTEFLLGFTHQLKALDSSAAVYGLAADTDGIDGSEQNAGALMTASTLQRARERGLNAFDYLARNDAFGFFEQLDDLVTIGPTLTNVNDYRVILLAE